MKEKSFRAWIYVSVVESVPLNEMHNLSLSTCQPKCLVASLGEMKVVQVLIFIVTRRSFLHHILAFFFLNFGMFGLLNSFFFLDTTHRESFEEMRNPLDEMNIWLCFFGTFSWFYSMSFVIFHLSLFPARLSALIKPSRQLREREKDTKLKWNWIKIIYTRPIIVESSWNPWWGDDRAQTLIFFFGGKLHKENLLMR